MSKTRKGLIGLLNSWKPIDEALPEIADDPVPIDRAAEKAAARAQDEKDLASGKISRADLSRKNGGGVRGARYVGPSERIQRLADEE